MTERPILFSAPMVRAILAGRKTQTRRVVKGTAREWLEPGMFNAEYVASSGNMFSPYGYAGGRMWVRETWQYYGWTEEGEPQVRYAADNSTAWPDVLREDEAAIERLTGIWAALSHPDNFNIDFHARDRRWRPSIFMPRWASRLLLEVTEVRIERLQVITRADAAAEGICYPDSEPKPTWYLNSNWPEENFAALWDSINGAGAWAGNPWVWVVEFKCVEKS